MAQYQENIRANKIHIIQIILKFNSKFKYFLTKNSIQIKINVKTKFVSIHSHKPPQRYKYRVIVLSK